MAFQSVPATAEAVIRGVQNSRILTMTHYAKVAVAYDEEDLQAYADAMDEWFSTDMLPLLSTEYVYESTVVRGLEQENDLTAIADAGAGAGEKAGSSYPANCAVVLKRLSGFTGRSARGRVYLAGISQADKASDENFVNGAAVQAWVDAHNNITAYLGSTVWNQVIVSRYSGGSKRFQGVTFAITAWDFTDARIDSRRDRLPNP